MLGLSLSAQMRFEGHISGSCGNEQEKRWIFEVRQHGLTPSLQILETIKAGNNLLALACEAELYWIREMVRLGYPYISKTCYNTQCT